jgi:Leucine-rich repeat (LRR) protein
MRFRLKSIFLILLPLATMGKLVGQCSDYFDPVCAANGLTYVNACYAEAAGQTTYSLGMCDDISGGCISSENIVPNYVGTDNYDPVCGCNNINYPNEGYAIAAGVNSFLPGICYITTYDVNYAFTAYNYDSDGDGVVVPTDNGCGFIADPVCGCGQTFLNPCFAMAAGCTNYVYGECENDCIDEVIIFSTGNPIIVLSSGGCLPVLEPVCGCNGQTYQNECYALEAGVIDYTPGACGTGSWCQNATVITCGEMINGVLEASDGNNYSTYDCVTGGIWSGVEDVYIINKTQVGDLQIGLEIQSAEDLDIFLFDGDCNELICLDRSITNNSTSNNEGIVYRNAPLGNYYIIVEAGNENAVSGYRLEVACGYLYCDLAVPLVCNTPYNGSNEFGTDAVLAYDFPALNVLNVDNNGPEVVHTFTLSEPDSVSITLSNLTADLEMFLMGSCNRDDGILGSQESGTTNEFIGLELSAGTYFVVVDGYNGAVSDYTLTVEYDCASSCNLAITASAAGASQCNLFGGVVEVEITSGTPPFLVRLTGPKSDYTSTNESVVRFDNLPNGSYFISARDLYNCTNSAFINLNSSSPTHPDLAALLSFYNGLDGANWDNNNGWAEGAEGTNCDPCSWYGVECENGRVVCIDLDGSADCLGNSNGGNGLSGDLPEELSQLTELRRLFLSYNEVSSIPASWSSLTQMERFRIDHAALQQTLPSFIGQWTNLQILDLSFNTLGGNIPASWSNLVNLQECYLGTNNLSGSLPTLPASWPGIVQLSLGNNSFTGGIPTEWTTLNLIGLDVSNNNLSGEIPSGFGSMTNLETLRMENNDFSGCYPSDSDVICDLEYAPLPLSAGFNFDGNPRLPWSGTLENLCLGGNEIGAPCDDSDAGTIGESIQSDCECALSVVAADLFLELGNEEGSTGIQECIPISVTQFTSLIGLQFSVTYDPSDLLFLAAQNPNDEVTGLTVNAVNNPTTGSLTFEWDDPTGNGVTLTGSAILIELCFQPIRCGNSTLAFSETPLPFDALDQQNAPVNIFVQDGAINSELGLASAQTNGPTCNNSNDGVAEVVPLGGVAPYTYLWSNGDTTRMIEGLSAGNYIVTVTDAEGCTGVSNTFGLAPVNPIVLSCPDDISVTIQSGDSGILLLPPLPDTAPCPLDGLAFSYSGATTQALTFGLPEVNFFNLGVTVVEYLVPGEDTCSFTITVLPSAIDCDDFQLASNTIAPPSCTDEQDGEIILTVSGGDGNYNYSWSNGADTEDISDLGAGLYILTVSDQSSCEVTSSYFLAPPLSLELSCSIVQQPSFPGSEDGIVRLLSENTQGITDLTIIGPSGSDQTDISNDVFVTGLTTGTHLFTITDEQGCSIDCELTLEATGVPSCNPLADSLVLVEFYNATDGPNWDNTWDLNAPLDTWYGVFTDGQCVTCLDLDGIPDCAESTSANGNNVRGIMPASIGQLSALEGIFLTDNFIEGSLPSSLGNLLELQSLLLDNNLLTEPIPLVLADLPLLDFVLVDFNRLTFEDLLPIVPFLETISYDYEPQADFYPDTLISRNAGNALTIDLGIDAAIQDNVYEWRKNGTLYTTITGDNTLSFAALLPSDAGVYTVCVTNPNAPELVLCSNDITLLVTNAEPLIINLPALETNAGEEICIPLVVTGYTAVAEIEFSLNYDGADLTYLNGNNFNTTLSDLGEVNLTEEPSAITFSYASPNGGITLPDEAILVELCFLVNSCADIPLSISGSPLNINILDDNGQNIELETTPGSITVTSNLSATFATENASCRQNNGSISVTVTGGSGAYTYDWSDGQNGVERTDLESGTNYSVTIIDINQGCTLVADAPVLGNEGTPVTTNLTATICAGSTYLFNGEELTTAGTYTADLLTTTFACDSTVNLELTILPVPLAEINGDTTFCPGDGAQLLSVADETGNTYSWSTGSETPTTTIDASLSTVSVTVTNAEGCSSTDEVQIIAGSLPTIAITGDTSVCGSETTILTASGGIFYAWSTGTNAASAELPVGTHAVEVTTAAGCTGNLLVEITASPPPFLPDYEAEVIGCGSGTPPVLELNVSVGETVDWFAANGDLLAAGQNTFTPSASGEYQASVRNTATGCTSTTQATFTYAIEDILAPTIQNCPPDQTVVLNLAEVSEVMVDWVPPTAQDNCELASLTSNLDPGSTITTSTQVVYNATDLAGNTANCVFNLTVRPTDPLVLYVDTLRIEVENDTARVPICVRNFIAVEGLQFSLSVVDSSGAFFSGIENIHPSLEPDADFTIEGSQDTLLRFLWTNNNGQPINLDLPDSTAIFYLLIPLVGENGSCAQLNFTDFPIERSAYRTPVGEVIPGTLGGPVCLPALATIAGRIYRDDLLPVRAVEVRCVGEDSTSITFTDNQGYYEFPDLLLGKPYEIIPALNTAHKNGVGLIDLTLTAKYMLEDFNFPTPYRLIAADVTNNGDILITDIVTMSRVIIDIYPEFPNNTSWRFVDADYIFPNPNNPWVEAFAETRTLLAFTKDSLQNDFIAIKIGDVDLSATNFFDNPNANQFLQTSTNIPNVRATSATGEESLRFQLEHPSTVRLRKYSAAGLLLQETTREYPPGEHLWELAPETPTDANFILETVEQE